MRIPSGVTDQYIYFVAVDATDFVSRETGLASFTVVRSRNGAADATYTTPTVAEIDAATMPGVYALLLDEDMTIDSGDDSQEVALHITHAGMAPVTRTFELYRSKLTAGETLTVASGVGSANSVQISGDSGAADNLENAFDDTAGPVPWLGIVDQGTAQSATGTTLVGRAAGAFANDTIIGCILWAFGSAQGYWQARVITDVDLATDTFTVDTWTVTPSGTITYKIFAGAPASSSLPIPVNVTQFGGSAGTFSGGRPEVKVNSLETGSIVASTFGAGAIDAAATSADFVTEIQSGLATAAALDTVDNFLDTEVAAILAAVDTEVAAILALLDDARGEPTQGAPPVNPDAMTKIDYLYKAFRNKIEQTATELRIYADNGTTLDHKATVSDDATTFTRGEMATGA